MLFRTSSLALAVAFIATTAAAKDPCTAISDRGDLPSYVVEGRPFRGKVTHIIDGDGLCVATGNGQNTWVEVRLANFFAPELNEGGRQAMSVLARLSMGRAIECVPTRGMNGRLTSYDRVHAVCRVGRRDLGDQMRAAGVREGGRGHPHG